MRNSFLLFILFLPFFQLCESIYSESHDDMLIQCRMGIKVLSKKREKHICEKDNFDDDFDYQIVNMEASYSGQKFMCISFEKFFQEQKLKFKISFSHELFGVNAFGIKHADISKGVFESSVKFKSSSIIVIPNKNQSIPQIFGFQLNGQDACPFCGQRLETPAVALIKKGDIVDTHFKYPWHMTIYHYELSNLQYKCGASLIRDNKIITAAHCVTNKNQKMHENKLIVRFEEDGKLLDSPKYQYKVFKVHVHELYDHQTFENDIAMLVLETSIDIVHSKSIRAICLPPQGMKFSGEGYVVGFGSTENQMNASRVLFETKLPIIRQEDCRDSNPQFFYNYLFETNFCAGKSGSGICTGDSGGGFYVYQKGLWILKGIVSNTKRSEDPSIVNPTCSGETYTLFTDVTKYLDWIDKRLG